MSQRGAPAAYKGYRLQALYTLKRILASTSDSSLVFHLEGLEDLDIWQEDHCLLEAIQVKSYENLVLSNLSPAETNSFFRRAVKLLRLPHPPTIKVVNFGSVGPEMRQAWAGDEPQRTQVSKKLIAKGLEESEVEDILTHIELVELNQVQEEDSVFSLLQESLTGTDPHSAFDLLNFWLYKIAEQQATVKRDNIIEKINDVGRFLVDRYAHHSEWFTSITPLAVQDILDDQHSRLKKEFYAGISAKYEHILADLDFRRENKLAEITEKFKNSRVVIIRGASGQGKSTLAYRYLHEAYPETWRFSIELIENRQHALKIARALAGHADAVRAPMAVYIDVSPHDTEWPELVKRLARHPHFQILVSIREEDFQRASVSGAEFDYEPVELLFDETEARLIYERAVASGQGKRFLDFDEAWDRFGSSGPLLEFVYLLTQTTTLRERLRDQVKRIRNEVRGSKIHPDELELLRLVSVASAHEARLRTQSLIDALDLPDPDQTLSLFEREYLIRLSSDKQYIQGLHPIRSNILVDLLTSPDINPWLESAIQVLPLMIEDDLETFTLSALINHPLWRTELLEAISQVALTTWAGLACVLRVILWTGVYDYIESNISALELAHKEFGQGWSFAVDLDLASVATTELNKSSLGDFLPPERQAVIEAIRASQTPKEEVFEPVYSWLKHLKTEPISPTSTADWSGAAELCFWETYLSATSHIEQWLSDDDLVNAVETLALSQLADLSLALHISSEQRQAEWAQTNSLGLQFRLAQEYHILFLEEQDSKITLHFLPLGFDLDDKDEQKSSTGEQVYQDRYHDETMDRIRLVRGLFPGHETYASQGHGYTMGDAFPSPLDSSINQTGVPASLLLPTWPVRVNAIAHGLGYNHFRPNTWPEYIEQELQLRQLTVTCLEQLQQALTKYLQRTKAIDVRKHIDMSQWFQCWASFKERALLPKSAVDSWGLAHEFSSNQSLQSIGQSVPKAIALQKYKPYLTARREYTSSLQIFLEQSLDVMTINFHTGKLPTRSPKRTEILKTLQQEGIKTNQTNFSIINLSVARTSLLAYQQRFRTLFGHRVNTKELIDLEKKEQDLLSIVWQLWYFFVNDPGQGWATPLRQIPGRINIAKRGLEKKIQQAIDSVSGKGTRVTVLQTVCGWAGESALWLRLDIESPIKLYDELDKLIAALRETIGPVEFQELAYHIIEQNWEHIVIVPVIRGRKLDRLAWKLRTLATVLSETESSMKIWSYVPQPIPTANWEMLELAMWDAEDIQLANRLSESVSSLCFLTTQLGDLRNVPDIPDQVQPVAQSYVENRATASCQLLQTAFDAIAEMCAKFNGLTPEEQERRENLREAIAGITQLHKLVQPSQEFNGRQEMTIDDIFEYAQRLEQARSLAEGIRLYWIADALDLIENTSNEETL